MLRRLACSLLLLPCLLNAEIDYKVRFNGTPNNKVLERLELSSTLTSLQEHPPSSLTALKQRAQNDLPRVIEILQSYGYYNAEASLRYEQERRKQIEVIVDLVPGPLFKLRDFNIISLADKPGFDAAEHDDFAPDPDYDLSKITLEELEIGIGMPARAVYVLDAQKLLIEQLERDAHPFAKIEEAVNIVDREKQSLSVTVFVNTGPAARFGAVSWSGLEEVDLEAVQRKLEWDEDQPFDRDLVRESWSNLSHSGLFAAVNISYPEPPDETGRLPIQITLKERKHRTIGLGVTYGTEQQVGGILEWEHRNFRGMGERVRAELELNFLEQRGRISYRKPDIWARHQDLRFYLEGLHENPEAYDVRKYSAELSLERRFGETLDVSGGIGFVRESTRDAASGNGTEHLLTLPISIYYRTIENPLNPTHGLALRYGLTPHISLSDSGLNFTRQLASCAYYQPLIQKEALIWANKLTLGSIAGAARARIPPADLFNAGSDRLLRGYKYKTVSPLSDKNKPLGGRSLWVYSTELRGRWNEDWGAVTFFDIGNVTSDPWPHFGDGALKSVGAGLRYYTDFGPLRVDVAVPLDRRKKVDNKWEVYASFGQAF